MVAPLTETSKTKLEQNYVDLCEAKNHVNMEMLATSHYFKLFCNRTLSIICNNIFSEVKGIPN